MEDRDYMALALSLAERGVGWASPNPMVGAVIVKDGKIIGHGTHEELLKTCEAYSEIYMTQIGNQSIGAGEEAAV